MTKKNNQRGEEDPDEEKQKPQAREKPVQVEPNCRENREPQGEQAGPTGGQLTTHHESSSSAKMQGEKERRGEAVSSRALPQYLLFTCAFKFQELL
jgi:hypothetical protein